MIDDIKDQNWLKQVITISAYTTIGRLDKLTAALHKALDFGVTVNEIKEVFIHLYSYAGSPRSVRGINTLIAVLNDRKERGIADDLGKESGLIGDASDKYENGEAVQMKITGMSASALKSTGYATLVPTIDVFLKEHLFFDIFGRDLLSYNTREIITIATLISMGGVEPIIQSHYIAASQLGVPQENIWLIIDVLEDELGTEKVASAREIASKVFADLENAKMQI
ncbi:carboxymuconolactone decarboxylase family protein [Sphingobacterium sp. MYb388]|uniref:carboxymuconolactone decarboxylase family protein n=1 Tax=Sphingobacterium sp. MYb388 TaxID=2745437 RepID=UPI0030B09B86